MKTINSKLLGDLLRPIIGKELEYPIEIMCNQNNMGISQNGSLSVHTVSKGLIDLFSEDEERLSRLEVKIDPLKLVEIRKTVLAKLV